MPPDFSPADIAPPNQSQNSLLALEGRRKSFLDMVRRGQTPNPNLRPKLEEIRTKYGDRLQSVQDSELVDQFPIDLPLLMQDYFNNNFIIEVFRSFQDRIVQFKVETYNGERLSDAQIYEKIGNRPPWDIINELFEQYGFSYRIKAPVYGVSYFPTFADVANGNLEVIFGDLSTGEKIIVTFVLWAFNASLSGYSSLFLFDEIDAHLNPSMSKMMMEIIRNKLVVEFGIQVIMTTHSPSTVAYTDDKNLFWMERNLPIRPAKKEEIIPILSDGIITVAPNSALRIFANMIGTSNLPILCVEGETDKIILETAWNKLFPGEKLPWDIHDVFDCYFLTNLFKRGKIFENYPTRNFIGLVDFDDAYKDLKEKLSDKDAKKNWDRTINNDDSVSFLHKNGRGVVTTLGVPAFRKTYAGPNIRAASLSIELLFEDNIVASYCSEQAMAGGGKILKFDDSRKVEFAKRAASFDKSAFDSFASLFARIKGYAG